MRGFDVERLPRNVLLVLRHGGATLLRAAQSFEFGECFFLLGGFPERAVGLRELILGDVVLGLRFSATACEARQRLRRLPERHQRAPQPDERFLEVGIVLQRLLEERRAPRSSSPAFRCISPIS